MAQGTLDNRQSCKQPVEISNRRRARKKCSRAECVQRSYHGASSTKTLVRQTSSCEVPLLKKSGIGPSEEVAEEKGCDPERSTLERVLKVLHLPGLPRASVASNMDTFLKEGHNK